MTEWITGNQAAAILGVSYSAVPKLIARGELHPRSGPRHQPSLNIAEVEDLAAQRRHKLNQIRQRQTAVLALREERGRRPDDEHAWLSFPQAAALMGITRQAMHMRAARGRVPYVEAGGRRWIRRDHLELVERARLAQAARQV